jgi:hypothetical protein
MHAAPVHPRAPAIADHWSAAAGLRRLPACGTISGGAPVSIRQRRSTGIAWIFSEHETPLDEISIISADQYDCRVPASHLSCDVGGGF